METHAHNKKINIVSLGCSKNTVDSEKLLKQIQAGGYSVVYDPSDLTADTVIINTCFPNYGYCFIIEVCLICSGVILFILTIILILKLK